MTDAWLRKLRVDKGRAEFRDSVAPGLTLRVSRLAKKWSVLRWNGKKKQRIQIGSYPEVSLRSARERATDPNLGMPDPASDGHLCDESPARLSDVIDGYLNKLADQPSCDRVRNVLRDGKYAFADYVAEHLGEDPAAVDVTPAVVTGWLREAHERAPYFVPDLHGYVHAAFQWAVEADHDPTRDGGSVTFGLEANPVAVVKKGQRREPDPFGKQIPLDELATYWHRLPDYAEPRTVIMCRLIIAMGGQRLIEIRASQKSAWRDGWLFMPKTKAGFPHSVPQTDLAKEQLRMAFALVKSESPYLFPNALDILRPVAEETVSKTLKVMRQDLGLGNWKMAWLRSTVKTALLDAELLDERTIDIWHNHGRNADMARRHYDAAEHRMLKQRCALVVDQFLRSVLSGEDPARKAAVSG